MIKVGKWYKVTGPSFGFRDSLLDAGRIYRWAALNARAATKVFAVMSPPVFLLKVYYGRILKVLDGEKIKYLVFDPSHHPSSVLESVDLQESSTMIKELVEHAKRHKGSAVKGSRS